MILQTDDMKQSLLFIATLLFLILPFIGLALPVGPPDPVSGNPPCDGPGFTGVCPIDGGVSFLIAAGLALGAKKTYDHKRKSIV